MTDGIIKTDSERGDSFGLTSDRFKPDTYLWKVGDCIYVSLISTQKPGNGDFRRLVQRIHALGYTVKVPTPLAQMEHILTRNGYKHTQEYDKESDDWTDVWVLEPPIMVGPRTRA